MVAKSERQNQEHHSYEDFTNRPFYVNINRKTVSLVPKSKNVVDIATGTGAVITQLVEQSKLSKDFWVSGFDVDDSALKEAEKKFENVQGGVFDFERAPAENLPIPDNSADVVTFCNAIHLTDVPNAFRQASRILVPGGLLALNTAYTSDMAYAPDAERPDGSKRSWGLLILLSRKIAQEKYGIEFPKDRPSQDILKYSSDDYRLLAQSAGFTNISIGRVDVRMNQQDIEAICRYKEFTEGALPNVEYNIARTCLLESVPELIARRKQTDSLTRGWMIMYAFKPSV